MTFPDFFNLSPSEAAEVAVAMLGLWAVAWVARALIRAVREVDDDGQGA